MSTSSSSVGPLHNILFPAVNPLLLSPPAAEQPTKMFTPPSCGEQISCDGKTYFLGKQIGQGHFGAVFECSDHWGNELVAKVLLPKGPYEVVRQRWQEELQSLLTLRHPNITHVYAAFEYRDTFYLVIERCSQSLRDLITWPGFKGELWLKPIARCILQATDFIHAAGYVHKDLHPGNILIRDIKGEMFEPNPVVTFKIGDLGISRLEPNIRLNTILADWMLPPEFLSPAEFGTIGKTLDIYHIGLLFLGILLGKIPSFTRDEILAGKPRQVAEGLASPFGSAIAKALRRHTSQRTQSATEFWQDIKTCWPSSFAA